MASLSLPCDYWKQISNCNIANYFQTVKTNLGQMCNVSKYFETEKGEALVTQNRFCEAVEPLD
jgi:hypothetical protein